MNLKQEVEKMRNDNYLEYVGKGGGCQLPFVSNPEIYLSAIHSAMAVCILNQEEQNSLSNEEYQCLELLWIYIDGMMIDTNKKIENHLATIECKTAI